MANLFEAPSWEAGIYQLETTDRALAGPDGILNVPFKQLANRTLALRKRLQQLRLNVLDFGAQAVPGFDNTQAFEQALAAAQAEGGGTVYAPAGRYELSGAITLPHLVGLEGAGSRRTQLVLQDAGPAAAHLQAAGELVPELPLLEPAAAGQRHLRVDATAGAELGATWLLAGAEADSFSGAAALPGEFVEEAQLKADFQQGSNILTGLSHGGVLRVGDALTAPDLLPSGTTVTAVGEGQVVLSAGALQTASQGGLSVAGLLPLVHPLRAAYVPGLAQLYSLAPVEVGLQGLSLVVLGPKPLLEVQLGRHCHFEDLLLTGPLAGQLRFGLCQGLVLSEVEARDAEPGPAEGAVLTLQGCEGVLLEKLRVDSVRTAVSLLPWPGGAALLNRQVQLKDSVLRGHGSLPVLEAGPNTDGLWLERLTCQGLLLLGGRDLTVRDSRLLQGRPEQEVLRFAQLRAGHLMLENNTFEGHRATGGAAAALVACGLQGLAGFSGPLLVEVRRNTWRYEGFVGTGLLFQASAGGRGVTLSLVENRFEAETESLAGQQRLGVRLLGQAEGGFAQVRLERNHFEGCNVLLDRLQASLAQVLHNTFVRATGDALSLLPATSYHPQQAEQAVYVQGNQLRACGRTGFSLVGDADGGKTRMWVLDNHLLDANQRSLATGAASTSLLVSTASQVVLSRNVLGSTQAVPPQVYGFGLLNLGVLFEHENQLVGSVETLSTNVAERLARVTHDGQLKEAYRSTAPVAGTWKAGDRVWNSAPNSRHNLGWVCIGGGTPGTWVPIGASRESVQIKLHGPFVMTAGQTVLTLPEPYQTNRRLLQVFRSGLALSQGSDPAGTDFDWVVESATSIRFRKPCLQDEVVEVIEFQIGEDDAATSAPAQLVQIQEVASGDINSTDGFDGNGSFNVSHPIALEPLPVVKISGIAELRYGIDYTVDGSTLTILPGAKPIAQEWLVVTYYYYAS
jgi:hypothetical protein